MYVKEIWRYPVKSMAGERIQQANVGLLGIDGDRVSKVVDGRGRLVTARTHPGLLGLDGRKPAADLIAAVHEIAGPGAKLIRDETEERFDILPLLVATDGAIAEFGRDVRRLRPNIVIGGVEGLAERQWPGRSLRIGDLAIRLDSLRGRCVVTTYDPDSLEQDPAILREIVRKFGGRLALNAWVEHPGPVEVGQAVELL